MGSVRFRFGLGFALLTIRQRVYLFLLWVSLSIDHFVSLCYYCTCVLLLTNWVRFAFFGEWVNGWMGPPAAELRFDSKLGSFCVFSMLDTGFSMFES